MRIETQTKISETLQRLCKELNIADIKPMLTSVPIAFLQAITFAKFPDAEGFLPGARDPVIFATHLEMFGEPARFQAQLAEMPEPNPYGLEQVLREIRSWPKLLKKAMASGAKEILPTGGPTEKLSDLSKVGSITDEFFRRSAQAETRQEILDDIAAREDVSVTTVIRRIDEEMERRRIMLEISKNSAD